MSKEQSSGIIMENTSKVRRMKNRDRDDRREAFIEASIPLFVYKGYANVSVRNVLDAVNDKTASPSVFYYYFSSKDELYRNCVSYVAESYISGFEESFDLQNDDLSVALIRFRNNIRKWFYIGHRLIGGTGSEALDYMFILDSKQQVTETISLRWMDFLRKYYPRSEEDLVILSRFLAGGIGEIIFSCVTNAEFSEKEFRQMINGILELMVSLLRIPEPEKRELAEKIRIS